MSEGIFRSRGFSLNSLLMLFYMVCIPIRLTLPIIVHKSKNEPTKKMIMIIIGFISIGLNIRGLNSGTWWHKKVHILTGASMIGSLLFPGIIEPEYIMLIDVLYGFLSSLAVCPFSAK